MARGMAARLIPAILFVTIGLLSSTTMAAETTDWHVDFPVFVSFGTHVQERSDSSHRFDTLSAMVEFRLSSPVRNWSASGFVNSQVSPDDDVADILNAGLLFRHRHSNWDTLAAVFHRNASGGRDSLGYFGRLRYRVAGNHKVGVESSGTHQQLDRSFLMLGYYGDFSQNLSLRLAAGSSIGNGQERAARVELVWQIN